VALARAWDAQVVVDAAHGSHWGRAAGLPPHPLTLGVDWVAHGLHKTEPVLTQTGLLLGPDGPAGLRADEWWRRLGTSSPSYPLLASIERYVDERERGDGGWGAHLERVAELRRLAARLGLRVLQAERENKGMRVDPAKITVWGDGPRLADALRRAGAEPEAVGLRSVTLVVGPPVTATMADWRRLFTALASVPTPPPLAEPPPAPGPAVMAPTAVDARPWRRVVWDEAAGRVAARALTPYPPGIPVVMPGEVVTEAAVAWLQAARRAGLRVEGADGADGKESGIWVLA
jgi:arginine/lysine/ornithine decarboxylase